MVAVHCGSYADEHCYCEIQSCVAGVALNRYTGHLVAAIAVLADLGAHCVLAGVDYSPAQVGRYNHSSRSVAEMEGMHEIAVFDRLDKRRKMVASLWAGSHSLNHRSRLDSGYSESWSAIGPQAFQTAADPGRTSLIRVVKRHFTLRGRNPGLAHKANVAVQQASAEHHVTYHLEPITARRKPPVHHLSAVLLAREC